MKKQCFISMVLMATLLSGCSLIPQYDRPDAGKPAQFSEADGAQPSAIATDWWKNFQSPELNALMADALAGNNDLNAALARVDQARGQLLSTSSYLLPSVDVSGNLARERIDAGSGRSSTTSTLATSSSRSRISNETSGSLGLSVGYELDLFGLNRANAKAGEYTLLSSEYAKDATALVVMGDVAKTYFEVLNLQERLAIADQNLDSARELLRIVQARFDAGSITALDVSQQKSDLASTEASRALILQDMKIAKSALAVLVGKPPESLQIANTTLRPFAIPVIAPSQPSDLLERRPDVRSAEASLLAANANIGAARAAFFPSINLSADLGLAFSPIGDAATKTISAGGSLLAPIFEGGLLEGNLLTSKGRKAELVENYKKSVLVSFKDVEDALTEVKTAQSRETSLETAVVESRKAYDLSKQQYDVGAIDFQVLLDARRTMLTAEDTYAVSRADRLDAAVDLYKALGGGWNISADAAPNEAAAKPIDAPDIVQQTQTPPAQNPVVTVSPDHI